MIKLTKCYIRGFGKYIDKEIKFDSNLSEFLDENGAGKTTLCDFIRAMFYGFRTTKKNNKKYTKRSKYKPWDSDNYGGNISFTYNGKDYVIDRTFDKKYNTKDTVKLFENNKELDVSKIDNLGFRFLELNEESFEKTLFIDGSNLKSAFEEDTDIEGRITKELGQIDSTYDIAGAIEKLEKEYKVYGETRKDASYLKQVNDEIKRIDEEIIEKREELATLDINEDRLVEIEQQKSKNNEYIELINQKNSYFVKKKNHESLTEKIRITEEKKQEKLNDFPKGIATEEEIKEVSECLTSLKTLKLVQPKAEETVEKIEVKEPKFKPKKLIVFFLILAAVFICLAVAGVILKVASDYQMLGLILICIGGGCFAISTIIYMILAIINNSTINKISKNTYHYLTNSKDKKVEVENLIPKEEADTSKVIAELEGKIDRFKRKYEIDDVAEFIKMCQKASEEIKRCDRDIEIYNVQAIESGFKVNLYFENKVSALPNLEELNIANKNLYSEEAIIKGDLDKYDRLKKEIGDLEVDKQDKLNLVEEYKKKATLINKTILLMKETQEEIKTRITEPLLNKFKEYSNELENVYGNKIVIASNLELKVENKGVAYDIQHLSSGELTLVSLAFRLSLISTLFKDGIPFLVLDDPFALLDDKHIEKTKSVINKISKDVQILYFTCHDSRRIK